MCVALGTRRGEGSWTSTYWNGEPQWSVYKKQCESVARYKTGMGLEEVF